MAKPRPSGDKRRRERDKQRKRQEKAERRKQRKEDKVAGINAAPEVVTLQEITGDFEDDSSGDGAVDEDAEVGHPRQRG